jgi:hypothetical protein
MITEQQFLKQVSEHVVEVHRDDGVYRHIRFRQPGTMMMHFDLITWPGYLCYCGDMGTYVFSRTKDMFEFFRTDREHARRHDRQLIINLSYWSEKLQAVDGRRRGRSALEFSEDKFRRVINDFRVNWIREAAREQTLDKEQRRELWEAVDQEVLGELDNSGDFAQHAAYRFSWSPGGQFSSRYDELWSFQDLWEHSFEEYTHHFTWCCYALAWGIQKYDESKTIAEAA